MTRPNDSPFIAYDAEFNRVLGETPQLVKVVDVDAHGGIPLVIGGQCVGAIGVSGETPAEDEAIALAGADATRTFA